MYIKAGFIEKEFTHASLKVVSKMPSKPALAIAILLAMSIVFFSVVAARQVPIESVRSDISALLQEVNHGISKREDGVTSTTPKGDNKGSMDVKEEKLIIAVPNTMIFPRRLPPQ